jgi:hypothetical protein
MEVSLYPERINPVFGYWCWGKETV